MECPRLALKRRRKTSEGLSHVPYTPSPGESVAMYVPLRLPRHAGMPPSRRALRPRIPFRVTSPPASRAVTARGGQPASMLISPPALLPGAASNKRPGVSADGSHAKQLLSGCGCCVVARLYIFFSRISCRALPGLEMWTCRVRDENSRRRCFSLFFAMGGLLF